MSAKINHMTWGNPEKDELKQLNAFMILKAVRMLLSSLILSGYVTLVVLIRYLGLPVNQFMFLTVPAVLLIAAYYVVYRNALVFGRRLEFEEDIRSKTMQKAFLGFINVVVLIHLFIIFADKMGFVTYILIALMSLATFWREWFMLILFAKKKYTVKDGDVYSRHKLDTVEHINVYHGMTWCTLVYLMNFEDAAGREIPVMVDRYTYRKIKEHSNALLINYKYGDSYLFEMIRLKEQG